MASHPERHGRADKVSRTLRYGDYGSYGDYGAVGPVTRRHARRAERVLVGGVRQVVVVALLPLWPFVAYPLSRAAWGRRPALHSVARHPVVTALGAPMRFVADRVSRVSLRRSGQGRSRPGSSGWDGGTPEAGDREPRRPKSGPPVDAIALPEPRG